MSENIIQAYAKVYKLPVSEGNYEWMWLSYKEESLFTQIFTPENQRGTVLLLHGFFDHTATNASFMRFLFEKGFQIITFDLPGHGFSGGPRFQVQTFAEYQEALRQVMNEVSRRNISQLHAVGHSTGGAIIAEAILENKLKQVDKVSLIAPLLRFNQWWVSKVSTMFLSPFIDEIPRRFRTNKKEASFMQTLKQDPLQGKEISFEWVQALIDWESQLVNKTPTEKPIQIIQGTEDYTVDADYNLKSYGVLFPYSDRILIDDGTHHLLNERPPQRNIVYSLILKYLQRK